MNIQNLINNNKVLFVIISIAIVVIAIGVPLALTGDTHELTVYAVDELIVNLSGSGTVKYKAHPKVKSEISGSGSVVPLE